MISPPDTPGHAEKDNPSAIDWEKLKERMRAVIRERADELGLSWNDYLDRVQDGEHCQDDGDVPAP
jgi:hypothetical protein